MAPSPYRHSDTSNSQSAARSSSARASNVRSCVGEMSTDCQTGSCVNTSRLGPKKRNRKRTTRVRSDTDRKRTRTLIADNGVGGWTSGRPSIFSDLSKPSRSNTFGYPSRGTTSSAAVRGPLIRSCWHPTWEVRSINVAKIRKLARHIAGSPNCSSRALSLPSVRVKGCAFMESLADVQDGANGSHAACLYPVYDRGCPRR